MYFMYVLFYIASGYLFIYLFWMNETKLIVRDKINFFFILKTHDAKVHNIHFGCNSSVKLADVK